MGGAVTIDRETESSSTEGLSGFSRGVVTLLHDGPRSGGAGAVPWRSVAMVCLRMFVVTVYEMSY